MIPASELLKSKNKNQENPVYRTIPVNGLNADKASYLQSHAVCSFIIIYNEFQPLTAIFRTRTAKQKNCLLFLSGQNCPAVNETLTSKRKTTNADAARFLKPPPENSKQQD